MAQWTASRHLNERDAGHEKDEGGPLLDGNVFGEHCHGEDGCCEDLELVRDLVCGCREVAESNK